MGKFIWFLVYLIVFQEKAGSWNGNYALLLNPLGNSAGSICWVDWSDTYGFDSYTIQGSFAK